MTAAGTDPEADPLTYRWDLDGNGTYETAGQRDVLRPDLQAPASPGSGSRSSDPSGHTATDTADVVVVWDFRGFLQPVTKPRS